MESDPLATDDPSTAADPDPADSPGEPVAGRRPSLTSAVRSLRSRLVRPATPGRSPVAAAALSFLWPGLGQLFLGRRAWAVIFTVPTLVLTCGPWFS